MVLSIFDIENFGFYFDIQPLKKLVDSTPSTIGDTSIQYYDYVLRGNKLGVGRDFLVNEKLKPVCELDVRGKIRCAEMYMVSDERKKDHIEPFDPTQCLDIIRETTVFTFNFKGSDSRKVGFIAQQMQNIYPDIVYEDQDGLSIDSNQVLAIVVGALKHIDIRLQSIEDVLTNKN
jgi:hypothetical protein